MVSNRLNQHKKYLEACDKRQGYHVVSGDTHAKGRWQYYLHANLTDLFENGLRVSAHHLGGSGR